MLSGMSFTFRGVAECNPTTTTAHTGAFLCTEKKQGPSWAGAWPGDPPTSSIALGVTPSNAALGFESQAVANWLLCGSRTAP